MSKKDINTDGAAYIGGKINTGGVLDTNGVEVSERMLLVDMIPWCQNHGMTCRVSKREITTEI
jgi:hypothetical protein